MKVAIPYLNDQIHPQFGKCNAYQIITVINKLIQQKELIEVEEHGHVARLTRLKDLGVDTLICGKIGEKAVDTLDVLQITYYRGIQGSIDQAIALLIEGTLVDVPLPQGGCGCGCHS